MSFDKDDQLERDGAYDETWYWSHRREENNPQQEPVGHYTGRCAHCHSKNLWDDVSAYGCNDCGWSTAFGVPRGGNGGTRTLRRC